MSKSRNDRRLRQKKLTGGKAVDPHCRNHGPCKACQNNRTIQQRRAKDAAKAQENDA